MHARRDLNKMVTAAAAAQPELKSTYLYYILRYRRGCEWA